jgi:hypothetical protein
MHQPNKLKLAHHINKYGVEVNERADSEAAIVNYCYKRQILKPSGKRKAKRSFAFSVKSAKGTEGKATLKGTTGMARLRGSAR